MRLFASSLCACFLLSTVSAEDKKTEPTKPTAEQVKRVEELKKAIAEKKAEVAKLEDELSKLQGATPFKAVKDLNLGTMEVGVRGGLRVNGVSPVVIVDTVVDENHFVAKLSYSRDYDEYVIIKMSTDGFADKQVKDKLSFKEWYVIGTRKRGSTTYFVLADEQPKK